jgi:ubiquinone/menaquinone biosynthesis C-methylase UbiE
MQETSLDKREFLPAAGRDWLLPLYDPFSKLLGATVAHRQLVLQAKLTKGQRVLDVGCGTGNLTLLVKRLHPDVDVVGLDPDPKALQRARSKAKRQNVDVRFERGFADSLADPDRSFDCVLSAFMFHHLKRDEKAATLRDIQRVLKPGGRLHVLDFAAADEHASGLLAHLFHRHEESGGTPEPTLVEQLREAGFAAAAEVAHRRNRVSRIAYHKGVAVG